tara:strand:- start:912 stop:1463 length:552 start_codon:yes stop_codon:yes gene_type:complete
MIFKQLKFKLGQPVIDYIVKRYILQRKILKVLKRLFLMIPPFIIYLLFFSNVYYKNMAAGLFGQLMGELEGKDATELDVYKDVPHVEYLFTNKIIGKKQLGQYYKVLEDKGISPEYVAVFSTRSADDIKGLIKESATVNEPGKKGGGKRNSKKRKSKRKQSRKSKRKKSRKSRKRSKTRRRRR